MAQTNFTPISLYYSATATNVPTAANLVAGELAINTADGKLFYKDSAGVVQTIASKDTNSGTFTNISVSGVASFADGTVSLPSITNIGDTNTGIFFPAADTIAFTEGGVESMRISSAGNLGINQTSPSYKLDINKGSAGIIANFTDGVAQTLRILTDASSAAIDSASGTNLGFQVGSVEYMRIGSTGNVGIGTTSSNRKLTVANASATSTTLLSNILTRLESNGSGADCSLQFSDTVTNSAGISMNQGNIVTTIAGGEVMRMTTAGNLGIGRTPDQRLQIAAPTAVEFDMFVGSTRTLTLYADATQTIVAAPTAVPMTFRTSDTERMRITSAGEVTIGNTSSSDFQFNVAGGASKRGLRVRSGGNGGITILDVADTNGNSGMQLQANGNFILAASYAEKASGTTWANPSDSRIKKNVVEYTKGLAELSQVNVKSWEYNGKANTTDGLKGLGVIADEIMQVLPDTVTTYEAKLNAEDETTTDIKRFDATEITWLLVNAVKELKTELDIVKAELQTLKGN
jgi:hypothetical protein